MRIFSLNVNSDRRVENPKSAVAPAFSAYSFNNRLPQLQELFETEFNKGTAFFALQEVDNNAKEKLTSYFESKGFKVESHRYCPDNDSFHYLVAYAPDKAKIIDSKQLFFTESGLPTAEEDRVKLSRDQKLLQHLGTEFEKSAQILKFKAEDEDIILVNIHPGLPEAHRLQVMKKLGENFKDENSPILIVGDLNMFSLDPATKKYCVYQEQIKVLEDYGFQCESRSLGEKGIQGTFTNYLYDIEQFMDDEQKKKINALKEAGSPEELRNEYLSIVEKNNLFLIGTAIDGVFTKNLQSEVKVKTKTLLRNGSEFTIFKPYKANKDEFNDKYKNLLKEGMPPTPSDHVGVVIKTSKLGGM